MEPFIQAIIKGDLRGIIYNKIGHRWSYALKCCAISGNLQIMKYLTGDGFELQCNEKDGALKWAAIYGHLDLVKYLVQNLKCAKYPYQNCMCIKHIEYAFRHAAKNGHTNIAQYFIENGVNRHCSDDYALNWALKNKHWETILILIMENNEMVHDELALKLCRENGYLNSAKFLINWGHNFNPNSYEKNYMFILTQYPFFDIVIQDWYNVCLHFILTLSKKNILSTVKKNGWYTFSLTKIFKDIFLTRRSNKHNLLKFILKPTSLHMQLIYI
jgi:ankyrin repeat protein